MLLLACVCGAPAVAAPRHFVPIAVNYSTEVIQPNATDSCTIVRPWTSVTGPGSQKYPVIIWVNGWDSDVDNDIGGYLPGLIEWAQDGPYVIVADNARNPHHADAFACAQWIAQQSMNHGSPYFGVTDPTQMGLAGHSEGGGVVLTDTAIRASFQLKGIVAMNPWNWGTGNAIWAQAAAQVSPVFLLGGSKDTTAPVATYTAPGWEAVQTAQRGGIFTVLNGATHDSEAWAPGSSSPDSCDFGRWQLPTTLWWRRIFHNDTQAGQALLNILNNVTPVQLVSDCAHYPLGAPVFTSAYQFAGGFSLP